MHILTFGEILSFCFQLIEWKRNSGVNQGPYLYYKCIKKMTCNNPNLDLINMDAKNQYGKTR